MKYTFTLTGPAEPQGVGGAALATPLSNVVRREKLVLESRAGESDRHIALKALSYTLFRDQTGGAPLRVEQGVGQRHKPDLVATEPAPLGNLPQTPPHAVVRLWIDCGAIEPRRLARIVAANPNARIVVVKPNRAEAAGYARAAAPQLPWEPSAKPKRGDNPRGGRAAGPEASAPTEAPAPPVVVGFDDAFFEAVRQSLRSRNEWTILALGDVAMLGDAAPDPARLALQIHDEAGRATVLETALYTFPLARSAG